jgi:uncharacterized pyridoxamine 5'-phosphate oxidase family protein
MRLRNKVVKEIHREFRAYDENDILVAVSDSAVNIARAIKTTSNYIFEYKNTNEYLFNSEKKKYRVTYVKSVSVREEPFVIPADKVVIITNNPGEVWKQIPGVPNCNWASTDGRFKVVDVAGNEMFSTIYKSVNNNKTFNKRTYYDVQIYNPSGSSIRVRASRVLVKTFIDSEFPLFYTKGDKVVVDHINNDSTDNRVSNLRIMTQSENLRSAIYDHGKSFGKKPKRILCVETGIIYDSAAAASRAMGLKYPMIIANAANPNQAPKTSCGFHWEYINEDQGDK